MPRAGKPPGRLGRPAVFGVRPARRRRASTPHKAVAAVIRAGLARVRLAPLAEAAVAVGMVAAATLVEVAVAAATPEAVVVGAERAAQPAAALAELTAANL